MGFFKKDEIQQREANEGKINAQEINLKGIEKKELNKKNLSIFETSTIGYVIDNFPEMSIEIQDGLSSITAILENTIDYIEDKSSEIIKKNRDFKLSKAYRDTSISIYEMVHNIDEYLKWMQREYEKNETIKASCSGKIKNGNEKLENVVLKGEEIEIYQDFSLKEPKGIKLDDNIIVVENWDDLIVKTAEILIKQYKNNKYSTNAVKEIKPVQKKSNQNSFRDTVIEMLTEYKINLDEFKVII
ncbi:hypothetical protein [Clostridium sp. YIM B02555]|jgi:hypothetical protein|uniref:hypothetical protein n=1 Tax=Clostridium sp. YIM B02555 TaxID=2911968 RepID=UPI001EEE50D8|nr:hypothetical protein [Clostridium sp. YIM B02555]